MTSQRAGSPVLCDMSTHSVLDPVPLAGAGRKITHRDLHTRLVAWSLYRDFSQPSATPVAPAAVGHDEQFTGLGVFLSAHPSPPAPATRHSVTVLHVSSRSPHYFHSTSTRNGDQPPRLARFPPLRCSELVSGTVELILGAAWQGMALRFRAITHPLPLLLTFWGYHHPGPIPQTPQSIDASSFSSATSC